MNKTQETAAKEKDQLLKRLLDAVKQCQIEFGGRTVLATELDSRVVCLCNSLEVVLQHGMKHNNRSLSAFKHVTMMSGLSKFSGLSDINAMETEPAFWNYVRMHLGQHEQQRFERLGHVTTAAGRGRAWLRAALNEKALEKYAHMLIESDSYLKQFYEDWAFLMDVERRNILPNVGAGLASILFAINIDNADLNTVRPPHPWTVTGERLEETTGPTHQEPAAAIAKDVPHNVPTDKGKRKKIGAKIVSFDEGLSQKQPASSRKTWDQYSGSLPTSPFYTQVTETDIPRKDPSVFKYSSPQHLSSSVKKSNAGQNVLQKNQDFGRHEERLSHAAAADVSTTPKLHDVTSDKPDRPTTLRRISSDIPAVALEPGSSTLQKSPSKTSLRSLPATDSLPPASESPKKGHRKSHSDTSMFKDLRSRIFRSGLDAIRKLSISEKGSSIASSPSQSLRSLASSDNVSVNDDYLIIEGPEGLVSDNSVLSSSYDSGNSFEKRYLAERRAGQDDEEDIASTSRQSRDTVPRSISATYQQDCSLVPVLSQSGVVKETDHMKSSQIAEPSAAQFTYKSFHGAVRTQGDGSPFPDSDTSTTATKALTELDGPLSLSPDDHGMSSAELKQAIVAMMARKDEMEERLKHMRFALDAEVEVSNSLRAELQEARQGYLAQQEKEAEKIRNLGREIELLKHQLRKYVSAVQLLRQRGICEEDLPGLHMSDPVQPVIPPRPALRDYSYEASEYESKLIQVAEMHGELMEFNTALQRQLVAKDNLLRSFRQQLEQLRGPLPASIPHPEDENSIVAEYERGPRNQSLVNLWIPSVFLRGSKKDGYHVYQVYVRVGDEEWNVYRRYQEFYELHNKLKKRHQIIASFTFPPKKALGNKGDRFVEERRQQLQQYLRHAVNVVCENTPDLKQKLSQRSLMKAVPFFCPQVEHKSTRQRSTSGSRGQASSSPGPRPARPQYQGL